ncbi:MAG: hypothetical protein Q9163_003196 [Psora crenata]
MSTKRKVTLSTPNVAAEETDTPNPKRRKLSDVHPQYYEEIALPMALDTIEGKLERREYQNISALESDIKRMISSAKSFNVKTSHIYFDAEKVRKYVSNFMTKHNPDYRDQGYQAVATPVPEASDKKSDKGEGALKEDVNPDVEEEESLSQSRSGERLSRNAAQTPAADQEGRRASSTPAIQDAEGAGESFEGNTFQQAQDKIVTEMIRLRNKEYVQPVLRTVTNIGCSNQLISANFIHLPSRTLQDYYKLIKHPVSLKGLQKLVRGVKGHALPTGITLLRSWHAFEQEASYIWNNARDYNEDKSIIVELAEELKAYFYRRLEEAKAVVNEPPQPRVKLTIGGKSPDPPLKITLKFGSSKTGAHSGISVDSQSLQRQQDLVNAGANGKGPTTSKASSDRPEGASDNSIVMDGIKREASHGHSPALSAGQVNGITNSTMPPPMHLGSGVHGGNSPFQPGPHNNAPSVAHYSNSVHASHLRQAGKDASDALITNLNLTTHPDSNLPPRFNLDIPASDTRTQQSVTVTLPNTHSYLRIALTLSSSLMQRPSKTFVTCNNRRQQALPQRELDQIRPLYEYVLSPGVNTIDVEVIAGLPRGAPKTDAGSDVEIEKITTFLYLQSP